MYKLIIVNLLKWSWVWLINCSNPPFSACADGSVAAPGPSWNFWPFGQTMLPRIQTSCTSFAFSCGIDESIAVSIITIDLFGSGINKDKVWSKVVYDLISKI